MPVPRVFISVLVGMLATGATAPAAAAPVRSFVVEGRGYGHGIGMGQWGAYRMALRGGTWRTIVHRYYPSARVARRPRDERLRIDLGSARHIVLSAHERVRVTSRAGTALRSHRARIVRRHRQTVVQRRAGGRWRTLERVRGPVTIRSGVPLWLSAGGEHRSYRGRLRVTARGERLAIVNVIGMQSYLRSVVPQEMPASWPRHALRAQAVAARSYAARVKEVARARGARTDICASAACQAYGGRAVRSTRSGRTVRLESPRTDTAVRRTAGRVLRAAGSVLLAMYSSSTGGHTTAGHVAGLEPVYDPADRASPSHRWRTRIPAADVRARWPALGPIRSVQVVERDGHGGWGGRAERIRIAGARGTRLVSAATFRIAFGLRSDWIRVRSSERP